MGYSSMDAQHRWEAERDARLEQALEERAIRALAAEFDTEMIGELTDCHS